jgi:hypothetical protein
VTRGAGALLVATSLIVSGCIESQNDVRIKPVGELAVQSRPFDQQLAYARGQLALGAIGLAIESFRKALRAQPDNPEVLRGLADSYAAMGRKDLAQHYYEAALAFAPQDPVLLQSVAPTPPPTLAEAAPSIAREQLSDTAPKPAPSSTSGSPKDPVPTRAAPVGEVQAPAAIPKTSVAAPMSAQIAASAPAKASPPPASLLASLPPGSILVELPPARPYRPKPVKPVQPPRLERLSPGEVALVTTTKPLWQGVSAPRALPSAAVRWAPVRTASAELPIRLLNAARHEGLAAHTRRLLAVNGWRRLQIGDAPQVQTKSIILYPVGSERAARDLADRLGFRMRSVPKGRAIVVLLGRDAARMKARQFRA